MADWNFVIDGVPQRFRDISVATGAPEGTVFIPVVSIGRSAGTASYTTADHEAQQVNGDTLVVAANANRLYALLVNDSDTDIYVSLDGNAAAVNAGVRINAEGGSYEMSLMAGNLTLGDIRANHGGVGNKRLLVTEGV